MGVSQSLENPTSQATNQVTSSPLSTKSTPNSNVEYVDSQTANKFGFESGMISTNYQCMLIGSYGDKYSTGDVVPKKSDKPGGKFLKGVSDDLEIIQDMIRNDPRKNLAYVLPDVPGAQRTAANYLSKIEKLLTESSDCGVLIWYTGHGQRNTGNWCFVDAKITFEEIFHLYEMHFRGHILTIVSDCCYSGHWVGRLADIMDAKGIGACGHKAIEEGYMIKVLASCSPQEGAYDTYYAKKSVFVQSSSSLMLVNLSTIINGSISQTPVGIDSTKLTCFQQQHDEPCKFDQIPSRASWKWIDLTDHERLRLVERRLFRGWCSENGESCWRFLIVYSDLFEEFCALFETEWPNNVDCDRFGYTVFRGIGEDPPEEIYHLFTKCGPRIVDLLRKKPTSVTAVGSKLRE